MGDIYVCNVARKCKVTGCSHKKKHHMTIACDTVCRASIFTELPVKCKVVEDKPMKKKQSNTKDQILLFSGGIDSYIAWHYLGKPRTVYFDLQNRYSQREKSVVLKLIPSTIIDTSLDLSEREIGEKAYIPFRNLQLALLAQHYSNDIIIAGIEDDCVSDKNPSAFNNFSTIMSSLENKEITVTSPFWEMSKSEIVAWYLNRKVAKSENWKELGKINLLQTISCYSPTAKSNYCGECPSCFRKWVAFWANDIFLPFNNLKLMGDYYQKAMQGSHYTGKRNAETLRVIEEYMKSCGMELAL